MLRFTNDLFPILRQLPRNDAKNDGFFICTKNPQLNCQPKVSKLRVVAIYMPGKKGGEFEMFGTDSNLID